MNKLLPTFVSTMNPEFKVQVIAHCELLLQQRIANAKAAMLEAQDAANSEEKSSAGDKYETGRAMGQLNRDMNAKQLAEAQKELTAFELLKHKTTYPIVGNGSLVDTSQGTFFIGAGLGKIQVNKKTVVALSAKSPLANLLMGKPVGEEVVLNGKPLKILSCE